MFPQEPEEQAVNTIMLVVMGICGHPHRLKKIQVYRRIEAGNSQIARGSYVYVE